MVTLERPSQRFRKITLFLANRALINWVPSCSKAPTLLFPFDAPCKNCNWPLKWDESLRISQSCWALRPQAGHSLQDAVNVCSRAESEGVCMSLNLHYKPRPSRMILIHARLVTYIPFSTHYGSSESESTQSTGSSTPLTQLNRHIQRVHKILIGLYIRPGDVGRYSNPSLSLSQGEPVSGTRCKQSNTLSRLNFSI